LLTEKFTSVRYFYKHLKGLSYEIENVDENLQILAFTRAAAGFFRGTSALSVKRPSYYVL
jgi:hypothetical protein